MRRYNFTYVKLTLINQKRKTHSIWAVSLSFYKESVLFVPGAIEHCTLEILSANVLRDDKLCLNN